MGRTAQGAGVNGEMMRWRRELGRAGIKVLDCDGREEIEEPRTSTRPTVGLPNVGAKEKGAVQRGVKDQNRNTVSEEVHGRRWSG